MAEPLKTSMSDEELIAELRRRGYSVLGEAASRLRCACGMGRRKCAARGSFRPCCAHCAETDGRSHKDRS